MIKGLIALFAAVFSFAAAAQDGTGIHFEQPATWEEALARAKEENKYVFVHFYTTWSSSCQEMSRNVFTKKEVGVFYNEHFMNLKVQLDTTDKDSETVKNWYASAKMLAKEYDVSFYPTYLFFDPTGTIVHRRTGSVSADDFLTTGANALDKDQQYYTLKRLYDDGLADTALLYNLAKASLDVFDFPFAKDVTLQYLATQKEMLTPHNIRLLAKIISSSKDTGFIQLLNHPDVFDNALGHPYATPKIRTIIWEETVYPATFKEDEPYAEPDWTAGLKAAKEKYPHHGPHVVAYYKAKHYQGTGHWGQFQLALTDYMNAYGHHSSPVELNDFAWTVFKNYKDAAMLNHALQWSKRAFANHNNPEFINTYANLLYKLGKKKDAIAWETKAIDFARKQNAETGGYEETLSKMKKGIPTW